MDFWSFGVVIYEMLHGYFPFVDNTIKTTEDIFNCVLTRPLSISKKISKHARDLLEGLLTKDPAQRLGNNGMHEILIHSFFKGLDWEKIEKREIKPPYIPKVKNVYDIKYIDEGILHEGIDCIYEHEEFSTLDKEMRYVKEFSYSKDINFPIDLDRIDTQVD